MCGRCKRDGKQKSALGKENAFFSVDNFLKQQILSLPLCCYIFLSCNTKCRDIAIFFSLDGFPVHSSFLGILKIQLLSKIFISFFAA